jgi:hypothetical protein
MPTDPKDTHDALAPGEHPEITGKGKGYHVTKWKSFPMYQCDTCHFNTLDEQIMIDHVENAKENNDRIAAELARG